MKTIYIKYKKIDFIKKDRIKIHKRKMFDDKIKIEFQKFHVYHKFDKTFIINIIEIKKSYAFITNFD